MNFVSSEKEISINNGLCVLYFYTPWLIYHKKMLIMFNKVEDKYKDIVYLAVDASYFKKTLSIYNVVSVPTVIVFNKGKEIDRFNGICLTSAFRAFFDDIYKKVKKLGDKNGKQDKA